MSNDFEVLDAYGSLGDNTLTGHLSIVNRAIREGINPHARVVISRTDINGLTLYDEEYKMRIDSEQQIVFLECDD